MSKINRTVLVPFSPEQMYHLVNRVDQYAEFLPWCSGADIHQESDEQMRATIHFSHGILSKSFTTQNDLVSNQSIQMGLVEGPFNYFKGEWKFEAPADNNQACHLSFTLEFEFNSPLIAMAVGSVFETATSSMVEAFTKRAQEVYAQPA